MSGYLYWVIPAVLIGGGWLYLHYRYPAGSRGRTTIRWSVRGLGLLFAFLFLNYTMPSHDIVRITGTDSRLTTIGWSNWLFYASPDSGTAESTSARQIRLIYAVFPDGESYVYRNEDTGWIWPPYFKYDSSDLQAEASNFVSTQENPKWVMVTHYGWRQAVLSIYPNAVRMVPVAGPDAKPFPWLNIVILVVLALILLMIRRVWLQFRERTVDPIVADASDMFEGIDAQADAARANVRGFWGRTRAWLNSWRKKP